MQDMLAQIWAYIQQYVPNLLAAIAILVLGWFAAIVLSYLVRIAVNKIARGKQLQEAVGTDIATTQKVGVWTGRVVFWVLMGFVVAAALQSLQLTSLSEPLDRVLQELTLYLPQLLGAVILVVIAWVLGLVLRFVVVRALDKTSLDKRVSESAGLGAERQLSKTMGEIVLWLPLLLFLPAILGTLRLEGLLTPLQGMFDDLLAVIPNLAAALLILFLGWVVARIVRRIVTAFMDALGADRVGERVGMGAEAGTRRLSAVVGLIVYALILIPAAIAALDALQIESVSRPASLMLNQFMLAVPMVFGAAIILAIAYLVGRLLAALAGNILEGIGFDLLFERMGLKVKLDEHSNPSQVAGTLVLIIVMLLAAVEAAEMLGFVALADLVQQFFEFGIRLMLGLVILGIGLFLGNLLYRLIPRGEGRWGRLYASTARIAVIFLATAMALQNVGVAEQIVTLAFGIIVGAAAVAIALAFGLGAREAAAGVVDRWLKGGSE
jgi:hypothetical protein